MVNGNHRGHAFTVGAPPSGWGRGWRHVSVPSLGIDRDVYGDETEAKEEVCLLVDEYDPPTAENVIARRAQGRLDLSEEVDRG